MIARDKMSASECPICKGTTLRNVTSKEVLGETYSVYQCLHAECMHGFIFPLPTEGALEKIYSGEALNDYQLDDTFLSSVDSFFSHLFDSYIPKTRKTPGSLLDIGAGIGTFMNTGRKYGWEVHGIEFNERSVAIAKRQFSLDVVNGSFYTLEKYFEHKKFDLIIMNHVFEHVLLPRDYIKYLTRFLNEEGYLLITVPNILSDDFKILGAQWSYIHIPAHISYFSKYSMDRILLVENNVYPVAHKFRKVFQSSFNSPEQKEGEGLTSMYEFVAS